MKRIVFVALLAALAMGAPAQASHEERTETKLYTQLAGDGVVLMCDASDPDLGGLGGVCFDLIGDEEDVKQIKIEDEVTGMPVGGYYDFTDALGLEGGESLASGTFCGSVSNLAIPAGAASLIIYVDVALGPLDCAFPASPGIGVRGTISATYRLIDQI